HSFSLHGFAPYCSAYIRFLKNWTLRRQMSIMPSPKSEERSAKELSMRSSVTLLSVALYVFTSAALFAQEAQSDHGKAEPPTTGIHWAKGEAPLAAKAPRNSPLMTNHGGNIMTNVQPVQAIFWGTKWNSATFTADKMTGLDTFYGGIGNSTYAHTCSEYS